MTLAAWSGAGLLLLLAVAFVALPLVRTRAAGTEARRRLNVELYRDRLAELDGELARGEIASADYESLEAELALTLLEDTAGADAVVASSARAHRRLAAGLAVVLVGAALLLYRELGAIDLVVLDRDRTLLTEAEVPEDRLAAWANRLESRLARRPDDAKSWYLLGHARMRQERFEGAAAAFDTLTRLTGDDPVVLSSLAQARYLADRGVVSDENRALMNRVLAVSPHEANVREMLALDAFRRSAFAEAAEHIEAALAGGVGGARADALRHALERARAADGGTAPAGAVAEAGAPAVPVADAAAAAAGSIRVKVTLAPGVEAAAPARVFVIAREAGGPPMPVAVRVLDPTQLPAEVVLSDADAMQPERALSKFARVDLVARLSRSGSAMRGEGDVESGVVSVDRADAASRSIALAIGG